MKVLMGKSKTAMSRKSSLMRSVRWNTPSKLSKVREREEKATVGTGDGDGGDGLRLHQLEH